MNNALLVLLKVGGGGCKRFKPKEIYKSKETFLGQDIQKHRPLPSSLYCRLALPGSAVCWPKPACWWSSKASPKLGWLHLPTGCCGWPPVPPCCKLQRLNLPPLQHCLHPAGWWASCALLPWKRLWSRASQKHTRWALLPMMDAQNQSLSLSVTHSALGLLLFIRPQRACVAASFRSKFLEFSNLTISGIAPAADEFRPSRVLRVIVCNGVLEWLYCAYPGLWSGPCWLDPGSWPAQPHRWLFSHHHPEPQAGDSPGSSPRCAFSAFGCRLYTKQGQQKNTFVTFALFFR